MNSDVGKETQEKPVGLVSHNIHDFGIDIMDMWINEVETRTAGRVHFTKTMGEDSSLIQRADVIRDVPAESERYRLLNLIQIPFIFPSSTVGSRVVAQLYAEFPELREELSDVKVVGLGIGALMAVFSSRAWGPLRRLEDFKGARMRSLSPIDGVIEAFGAVPLHVGYSEISGFLERGELDATVLGILPAWTFKLAERAAPYCTIPGDLSISMHPLRTFMKWDTWNRLPSDIQEIIDGIGPAGSDCWFAIRIGPDADNHLREALEYFRQYGEIIKIETDDLERWRRPVKPLMDAALDAVEAEGLPGRRFFGRMLELVKEYS